MHTFCSDSAAWHVDAVPAPSFVCVSCVQFMMGCYEDELKRPLRNLVNGQLLRTILIQVCPLGARMLG